MLGPSIYSENWKTSTILLAMFYFPCRRKRIVHKSNKNKPGPDIKGNFKRVQLDHKLTQQHMCTYMHETLWHMHIPTESYESIDGTKQASKQKCIHTYIHTFIQVKIKRPGGMLTQMCLFAFLPYPFHTVQTEFQSSTRAWTKQECRPTTRQGPTKDFTKDPRSLCVYFTTKMSVVRPSRVLGKEVLLRRCQPLHRCCQCIHSKAVGFRRSCFRRLLPSHCTL